MLSLSIDEGIYSLLSLILFLSSLLLLDLASLLGESETFALEPYLPIGMEWFIAEFYFYWMTNWFMPWFPWWSLSNWPPCLNASTELLFIPRSCSWFDLPGFTVFDLILFFTSFGSILLPEPLSDYLILCLDSSSGNRGASCLIWPWASYSYWLFYT